MKFASKLRHMKFWDQTITIGSIQFVNCNNLNDVKDVNFNEKMEKI